MKKSVDRENVDDEEVEEEGRKVTLEALDAISDDDSEEEEGHGVDDEPGEENDEGGENGEEEWGAEVLALRKAIQEGRFDVLLKKASKDDKTKKKGESKEEEKEGRKKDKKVEKAEDGDEVHDEQEGYFQEVLMESEDDEDEADQDQDDVGNKQPKENHQEDSDEEEKSDDEEGEEEEKDEAGAKKQTTKALALATAIQAVDRHLPWAETFVVVPPTPLPFGPVETSMGSAVGKKRKRKNDEGEEDEEETNVIDIHDDLKREVAFYNCALEAVNIAREKCAKVGIPFTRPDDFFAEMVKSDGESFSRFRLHSRASASSELLSVMF